MNALGSVTRSAGLLGVALAIFPTVGQKTWHLPVTIEAMRDVSVRRDGPGPVQARGVLYVTEHDAFTIKKGQRFLMVKIGGEGSCDIAYAKRQYLVSSCPWLDGFRDHQEDFFKVVAALK